MAPKTFRPIPTTISAIRYVDEESLKEIAEWLGTNAGTKDSPRQAPVITHVAVNRVYLDAWDEVKHLEIGEWVCRHDGTGHIWKESDQIFAENYFEVT